MARIAKLSDDYYVNFDDHWLYSAHNEKIIEISRRPLEVLEYLCEYPNCPKEANDINQSLEEGCLSAGAIRSRILKLRKSHSIFYEVIIHNSSGYKYIGKKIETINDEKSITEYNGTNSIEIIIKESLHGIKDNKTIKVERGFETNLFYSYLLENSKKRLWVWGRKNKKLFDRSFIQKFQDIQKRSIDGEFSLRVLFLNPGSDESLLNTAQKKTSFSNALKQSIFDAKDILEDADINFFEVCRCYSVQRTAPIMISDDLVYFTNIRLDEDGMPEHLTDSYFYITCVDSSMGRKYVKSFEDCWKQSVKCEDCYE